METCRRLLLKFYWDPFDRGHWETQLHYVWTLIAVSVGLSDVIDFTFYVARDGGAFIVAYVVLVLCLGIPFMTLELALGQFTSCGIATCWQFSRLFSGVGIAQIILLIIWDINYVVILGYCLLYLVQSFKTTPPWMVCDPEFASELCLDFVPVRNAEDCLLANLTTADDGACYDEFVTPRRLAGLWNYSLARSNNIKRRLPSLDYMGIDRNGQLRGEVGPMQWDVLLCLLASWIIIDLLCSWGLKPLNKMMNVLIYVGLTIMFVLMCVVCSFQGSSLGIAYFFHTDWSRLRSMDLWLSATSHVLDTLMVGLGLMVSLASYNSYRGDMCLYAIITSLANVLVSLAAGVFVFGCVGALAYKLEVDMDELVVEDRLSMVFAVIPYALHVVNGGASSTLLLVLFYIMMYALALTTQTYTMLVPMCNASDIFLGLRPHKHAVLILVSLLLFALAIPCTMVGGYALISTYDKYGRMIPFHLLLLLELVSMTWVYGSAQFLLDIRDMVGARVFFGTLPFSHYRHWLELCWVYACHILLVMQLVANVESFKADHAKDDLGQHVVGVILIVVVLLSVPGKVAYDTYMNYKAVPVKKRLMALTYPSEMWGPSLLKDRQKWMKTLCQGSVSMVRSDLNTRDGGGLLEADRAASNMSFESLSHLQMVRQMRRNRKVSVSDFFHKSADQKCADSLTSHHDIV